MDALHENIAQYTHSGSSRATWRQPANSSIGISFEYRANANKAKGAPIDLVFPKEGLGWDLEAFGDPQGHEEASPRRRSSPTGRSSKDAMQLYGKNFAITAQPGVAEPLPNVPADYETRAGEDGLSRAPRRTRERILAEWNKRYNAKSEPKK